MCGLPLHLSSIFGPESPRRSGLATRLRRRHANAELGKASAQCQQAADLAGGYGASHRGSGRSDGFILDTLFRTRPLDSPSYLGGRGEMQVVG